MHEQNDWRLTNQIKYLKGEALTWKRFTPIADYDHDHCEFCWAKFMDEDDPEIQREGYVTSSGHTWICRVCCDDFKDMFEWKISESAS